MLRTNTEIEQLSHMLEQHILIAYNKDRELKNESTCHKINRQLHCRNLEDDRLIAISQLFCYSLDNLEKTPIQFNKSLKSEQNQRDLFKCYLEIADKVIEQLNESHSEKIKLELNAVLLRVVGLKYRIEDVHGGLNKTSSIIGELIKSLLKLAETWKAKQKLYPEKDKALKPRDIIRVEQACYYPEFTKLLLTDESLQDTFFKWSIRDNNGVDQFVEFPATCARIRSAYLDKRVGRLHSNELSIKKSQIASCSEDAYEKDICLPFFDGQKVNRISILDESREIQMNGNRRATIKEIFSSFAFKNIDPGNVSYFGTTGITNWANYELGSWNAETKSYDRINLKAASWWNQLPLFEVLTKAEVEKKYQLKLDEGDWVRSLRSTLESIEYDVLGRHGFLEMAIPLKNGSYGIYSFGFFPLSYPTDKLGKIRLVVQTVEGRISYPDENPFYTQRQQAIHPKKITEALGLLYMSRIKKEIELGLAGKLGFQISGENCCWKAQEIVQHVEGPTAPNAFTIPLNQLRPSNSKGILKYLVRLPAPLKDEIVNLLGFLAKKEGMMVYQFVSENNSSEKKADTAKSSINDMVLFAKKCGMIDYDPKQEIYKTTKYANFFEEQNHHQPAHLNHQIENGELHGRIFFGN